MLRLPRVIDRADLDARGGERPAHQLDHVAVLRVGREREVEPRPGERRGRREPARRGVALRDVHNVRAGAGEPGDLGVIDVDAMPAEQPPVEEPGIGEDLRRRLAGAGGDALELDLALAEMGVDDGVAAMRLGGEAREIRLGAGIGGMRRELHRDPAVLFPVPGRVGGDVAIKEIVADRGVEAPVARRDRTEIDVVQTQARVHAQAELRELRQAGVQVDEMLADQRRAEAERLHRAEAREDRGLLGREVERVRNAFRVGGREPEIRRNAAHHRERAVGVHVDEAWLTTCPASSSVRAAGGAGSAASPSAAIRSPCTASQPSRMTASPVASVAPRRRRSQVGLIRNESALTDERARGWISAEEADEAYRRRGVTGTRARRAPASPATMERARAPACARVGRAPERDAPTRGVLREACYSATISDVTSQTTDATPPSRTVAPAMRIVVRSTMPEVRRCQAKRRNGPSTARIAASVTETRSIAGLAVRHCVPPGFRVRCGPDQA